MLNAAALQLMRDRGIEFRAGLREAADRGRAERVAYCTPATHPIVIALYRKTGRSRRPAFLANVFRAEAARPDFCNPGS